MAQATKKRIMDGFLELLEQRPLDKISVVDIADHCGINRNTFYYYYCDVYALIRELMEVRAQQLITDNQEDLNWIEITREVTSFFSPTAARCTTCSTPASGTCWRTTSTT